jgi:hypothetical protein
MMDKKKAGRPPKLVENDEMLRQIASLARMQCTHQEAANVVGVCRSAFSMFLANNKKAAECWENGQGQGRVSLRRLQWETAKRSAAMQIWLGKQYLGQRDKREQSGPVREYIVTDVQRSDDGPIGS